MSTPLSLLLVIGKIFIITFPRKLRSILRIVIPRFSRGIEEFYDEEFLARKTYEEYEELTGLKKSFFREKKIRKLNKNANYEI